jgi:hypothetical protein
MGFIMLPPPLFFGGFASAGNSPFLRANGDDFGRVIFFIEPGSDGRKKNLLFFPVPLLLLAEDDDDMAPTR